MTRRAKFKILAVLLGIMALGSSLSACGSWQPQMNDGKCSTDRHWVPPSTDAETGEQKEGYCAWDEGRR